MNIRTRLLGTAAALGLALLTAHPVGAAALYDVDAYAFVNVPVSINGSITAGPVTVTYSINIPVSACAYFSLDDQDPVVPEAGIAGTPSGCSGSGSGSYSQSQCGLGTLSGSFTLNSGGDTDTINYSGNVVGTIAVITGTAGNGATVAGTALLVPSGTQNCETGGITSLSITGALTLAG